MSLAWIPLAAGLLAGCVTPVAIHTSEEASAHRIRKLALEPFSVTTEVAEAYADSAFEDPVASLVTARVLEALTLSTSFDVIPPEEVARLLEAERVAEGAAIGEVLQRAFGVDAILSGTVQRFVPRIGGGRSASQPAQVRFEMTLRTPAGSKLWEGTYDEVQGSLADDPGSFQRAMQRGFRWVTAEDLARYGAQQLVGRMPKP